MKTYVTTVKGMAQWLFIFLASAGGCLAVPLLAPISVFLAILAGIQAIGIALERKSRR
jgi:hypothetical protein